MNVNLYPKVVAIAAHDWLVFHEQAKHAVADARPGDTKPIHANVPHDVAVIPITGVLLPSVPEWMRTFGLRVTGYDEISAQVKAAAANPSINEIVLAVDSPGGTVQGVAAAHAVIRNAAASKQVTAWVEGMCASGAYWLTCCASQIIAATTAEVGSIGVYQVWYDESARLEKAGITTHVIRSGSHKGMGLDKITPEQLETEQETVDDLAALFVQAVAAGRKKALNEVMELATGQTWTAARARSAGLVDRVTETYEFGQLVSDEQEITMAKKISDEQPVADVETVETVETEEVVEATDDDAPTDAEPVTETAPDAAAVERARCAAIVATFGKLDPAFCADMIAGGQTEEQAKAAWFDKSPPKPTATHAGAAPIPTSEVPTDAPRPKVMDRAKALRAQNPGMSDIAALKAVQAEDPETFARFQRGEDV